MKKNKTKILIILITLLAIGGIIFLFLSNQEGFTGNRIKNPDSYMLDIERMNGTDLHTLDLQKDDVLQIQFETVKGSLYMEIKAPDGTTIYRGNGKEATDFTVNIKESGVYVVVVEARHAKGTIHIQCAQIDKETINTESSEEMQQNIELVGPWHLDSEKNDLAVIADSLDLFPGYSEWGASMEIRSNGQMSWYIGAAGGCGTYTIDGDLLHAALVNDIDQKDMSMDFCILVENEKAVLEMNYQNMTVYWAYGD